MVEDTHTSRPPSPADELRRAAALMRDDGSRPHRFPTPAPDGEIIAWVCRACGETVSECRDLTDCSVKWREPSPFLAALADWLDRVARPTYCASPGEERSARAVARAHLGEA